MSDTDNATFYIFKPTGKYYTSNRGYVPSGLFSPYEGGQKARKELVAANGGTCMPGLNSDGASYHVVVILDPEIPFGWPIHLNPLGVW